MKAWLSQSMQRLRETVGARMPSLAGLGNGLGADGLPVRLSSRTYAGTQRQPVRAPCRVGALVVISDWREPPLAKRGQARVGRGAIADVGAPMHGYAVVAAYVDRTAQAVERQPLRQIIGGIGLAIDQCVLAGRPDDEIEQGLALRRQQRRPGRQVAAYIVGDQPLEELENVLAVVARRDAQYGAVEQSGGAHVRQGGSYRAAWQLFVKSDHSHWRSLTWQGRIPSPYCEQFAISSRSGDP